MSTLHFDIKAKDWDKDLEKTERAKLIATQMVQVIQPNKQLNALEFGCGTGLLSFELKDYFKEITLVDYSEGMINVLKEKIEFQNIKNFKPLLIDLIKNPSKIEKLSVNGCEGTRKKFNIHNHAAEIIGLYESLKK